MLIVCESYLYSLQICIKIWYNTIIKTAIKCDIRCKIKSCNCRLFSWATYHAPVAELAYAAASNPVFLRGENLIVHSTHTKKNGAVNVEFETPAKSGQKSASLKKLKIVKAANSIHPAWKKIS